MYKTNFVQENKDSLLREQIFAVLAEHPSYGHRRISIALNIGKKRKGTPEFTKEELAEGFEQIWVPYDKALFFVSNNIATGLEGHSYIVPRDASFLKAAKQKLKKY